MSRRVYVLNQSTLVSNAEVKAMAEAVAFQVKHHVAPLWGKRSLSVIYTSNAADATPGSYVISILDDPDQANALGWHTEDTGEVVYGRVFARPVLDNGGDALTRPLSVASVLSHEVLETYIDPSVNFWADAGNGTAYALEIGDPVESDWYAIPVSDGNGGVINVSVSNFVTPHWFDPQALHTDRFDYMGKVTAPFQMTRGGYVVVLQEGQVSQKFGEEYPAWRQAWKTRGARRSSLSVVNPGA